MDFNGLNKMVGWERTKALFLASTAENLGMSLDGYGEVAVNPNSGYTYIWLKDYNFTLYMPINCELNKSDVWVLYSCPYDGEESEIQLEDDTLNDLEEWAARMAEDSTEKEEA